MRSTSSAEPAASAQDQRHEAVRAFATEAARLAANTRCRNVLLLDVRRLSPVTDYMIVATGTSPPQMHTVTEQIGELGSSRGFAPLSQSGVKGENWMLLDFV